MAVQVGGGGGARTAIFIDVMCKCMEKQKPQIIFYHCDSGKIFSYNSGRNVSSSVGTDL